MAFRKKLNSEEEIDEFLNEFIQQMKKRGMEGTDGVIKFSHMVQFVYAQKLHTNPLLQV